MVYVYDYTEKIYSYSDDKLRYEYEIYILNWINLRNYCVCL